MDTSTLSSVYQSEGPFATVLTDVSHDTGPGEHEHELRVRAACEQLLEQGADETVVELARGRLGELVARPSPLARLVVATAAGVLYDETVGMRVDRSVASWGPLPDLTTWIAHRDSAVTFVLAVVDHEGGDVALFDSDVPEAKEESSVGGETEFVHKVPVGGWSVLTYQHNSENVWAQNAEAVVDEVMSHVRKGHRLVLLAGDPRSRGIVRDRLPDAQVELVELETGTRAEDGGDEALQHAVRVALLEYVVSRRLALIHDLRERMGQDYAVATGVHDVADALVRGQVDTLLLDPTGATNLDLDVTQHPGLDLGGSMREKAVRADQGLVAAAVLTDAAVAVVPAVGMGGAPVAALLRWDQDAVGTDQE